MRFGQVNRTSQLKYEADFELFSRGETMAICAHYVRGSALKEKMSLVALHCAIQLFGSVEAMNA